MERSADWMDQAEGDLIHGRHDLEHGFYDWSCFSAQQASEKALKSVFQALGHEAWGHSAGDLVYELGKIRSVPDDLQDLALELDKAYISTRYPDAHPSGSPRRRYTKGEAERLVAYASKIVEYCKDFLAAL